jgi:DNA-binding NarL/FixJ family response regulator
MSQIENLASNVKVLVAEDSPVMRDYLQSVVNRLAGADLVAKTTTVADTLQAFQQNEPDVLILDIKMPDGSGLQVLEAVKKAPKPPVVIVFTFYPYPQYRTKALQAGADYFLDKTKDFFKVEETLLDLIRQKSASSS